MKTVQEVAAHLEKIVDERSMPAFFTLTWPQMLAICERKQWREAFAEELQEESLRRGFIIGYGREVVFVAADALVWQL